MDHCRSTRRPRLPIVTGRQGSLESTEDGWWRWEVEEDPDAEAAIARTGYGTAATGGGLSDTYRDTYEGVVGVSRADPGIAFADGESTFAISWAETSVRTEAHVRIDSDAINYRVGIDLEVEENGVSIARKHWDQVFPRDLQ